MAEDWDRIEREYRANQLSNLEIARQHQVSEANIRKRAKAHGWTKDLTKKINDQTHLKLVRADGASASPSSHLALDNAFVGVVADRNVTVILRHRNTLRRVDALAEKLLGDLELSYEAPKAPEDYSDKLQADKHAEVLAMSVRDKATALREVANMLKQTIPLERQAFRLDEVEEAKKDTGADDLRRAQLLESLNATIMAVRKKGELANVIEGDKVL